MREPYLLHNIGPRISSNYNTREEILALPKDIPLTFDGIYLNVFENRDILLDRDVTLFIVGSTIGGDNTFDLPNLNPPKLEKYCDWIQLFLLRDKYGCKFGYHSLSHLALDSLNDDELTKEMMPPMKMDAFAYPAGIFNERVIAKAKELGYKEAYSVTQGDGSQFQKKRRYLNW